MVHRPNISAARLPALASQVKAQRQLPSLDPAQLRKFASCARTILIPIDSRRTNAGVLDLGEHNLHDVLESLHLLLDRPAHAGVAEADGVGDVDWQLCPSGDEFGDAGGELYGWLVGKEGRCQGLRCVEALAC